MPTRWEDTATGWAPARAPSVYIAWPLWVADSLQSVAAEGPEADPDWPGRSPGPSSPADLLQLLLPPRVPPGTPLQPKPHLHICTDSEPCLEARKMSGVFQARTQVLLVTTSPAGSAVLPKPTSAGWEETLPPSQGSPGSRTDLHLCSLGLLLPTKPLTALHLPALGPAPPPPE